MTYKPPIVLVGHSCSGKTTLAKELEKYGYSKIITYTTRKIRDNEVKGVDYHFITKSDFKKLFAKGFFAEFTTYKTSENLRMYGSSKSSYKTKKESVIVLEPEGVMSIDELGIDCFIVHLDISKNILQKRAIERGVPSGEFESRFQRDDLLMQKMIKKVDVNLTIKYSKSVDSMARRIIKNYNY